MSYFIKLIIIMGLSDFFRKGVEKPVAQKPAAPSQPAPAAPKRTYTVKSGDSLSKIAKQHYGNANEWRRIFEANRGMIQDPNLIYPGQEFVIPEAQTSNAPTDGQPVHAAKPSRQTNPQATNPSSFFHS
ncbi:LysM domain-containing protein [Catalinimonas alkaloidigena]|uniref:Potassium binding protein Kbp n=1 Tax=Catalinimonas alkaloidigena TaxID=1075417 RepID=A0A1G9Q464_9BACT|nr:LysM peptidoglycan-binding domain-containing protein [Catalinimonas alkaloidigena]SDM05703.1 LysM domain-containing protein [Catalinimonas alkaloidigena]